VCLAKTWLRDERLTGLVRVVLLQLVLCVSRVTSLVRVTCHVSRVVIAGAKPASIPRPGMEGAGVREDSSAPWNALQQPLALTHDKQTHDKQTHDKETHDKETQCDTNTFDEIAGFLYKEGHFEDNMHTGSVIFATRGGTTIF
jgi:hypothetical protein